MLGYEFDLFSRQEAQPQQIIQELQKSPVKDSATFVPVFEENLKTKIGFDKILHDFSIEKGNELICSSPKVTSVFFDKNSNEIPYSYLAKDNSLDSYSEPIPLHCNILFDILDILSSNSKTSIDIIAYSSTDESDTTTLKKKRLDAITHFFEKNGIDNNRISVSKKQIFSNETYDTGKEENRRVDIIIKGDILTNFVSDFYLNNVKGYTKIIPDTGNILFPSRIKVEDKYQQYRISSKDMLFTYVIPSDIYDEYFTYEIKYLDDTKSDTTFSIKKESMKVNMFDLRTDNFLAVLTFDYNSAELSNIAKQTLRELVRFLPENMSILISGSTDSTGTESRNAVLTKMRASNAKKYMESISYPKILKFEETVDSTRFSNSSPVGRFLNRSIRIRLKKD
jgi:outer membrane protein OmpA-like peptidoglycan-associated protein